MRETRSARRRSFRVALAAVPVALALGSGVIASPALAQVGSSGSTGGGGGGVSGYLDPGEVPQRTPIRTDHPKIEGLPQGVSIDRVEWITDRRVAVFIKSAAMPEHPIQVQILLARDWHSNPTAKFPEVWALDGLRAVDTENGWTIHTNIEQFYADKNVNVILPVGGESSFYTDWEGPAKGKNYKWESFLLNELPAVLQNGYRSNGQRAITGLSMGGTAAMNLAQHRPDMFNFVGSFSGYLDTTSVGMPEMLKGALVEGGGYDINNMWGPAYSQRWVDNDPKLGIEALKGKTVYVSAGSGRDDFGEPGSVATGPSNEAGKGLEVVSRMTTQTFVERAKQANVPVVAQFRPSGIHNWPYWQFEMAQSWPYIADSLGMKKEDRGADCTTSGAIGDATANNAFGPCVNNEYDVEGGRAQDFRSGRAYWTNETGAHVLAGRIGARYTEMGATTSWLGFPITGETATPDGVGRFVHFQHGSIYWTPTTDAVEVPRDMVDAWGTEGYEGGLLGYPVDVPKQVDSALVQQFQGGYVVRNKDKHSFPVRGEIAKKYGQLKTASSKLGAPTSNEFQIPGGALQNFENGTMYWSPSTGANFVLNGEIRDAWGKAGFENGPFGWPVADQESIAAGGEQMKFQHGTIKQVNGRIVEERH
ncbi:alpha/beta hydrolase-fold protein [Corynebacterium sp. H127]|uniref:alpha/beta hydrolase-fold protein n=1 Tax=Corynebacterium sp. H127 TaxID=3133418 RepID=UPI0030A42890